jgi:hypothetical protein
MKFMLIIAKARRTRKDAAMKFLQKSLAVSLLVLCFSVNVVSANGDDDDETDAGPSTAGLISNTTIIWLKKPFADIDPEKINNFVKLFEAPGISKLANLGGFIVQGNASEIRQAIRINAAKLPEIHSVENDTLIHFFAEDCQGEKLLPASDTKDAGVARVTRSATVNPGTKLVWIIDSGIAGNFDGDDLKVNRTKSRRCTQMGCVPAKAINDGVGHGTMIAGIIGAVDGNGKGMIGVAPGAELVPIKIFGGGKSRLSAAANALDYVKGAAVSGEVVNISWGYEVPFDSSEAVKTGIELKLQQMADKGLKISVAAGNIETARQSGYVQTVSPARIGGYVNMATGGAIVTASAVHSIFNGVKWIDKFWAGSMFGNGEVDDKGTPDDYSDDDPQMGPPNFAEPGVEIQSLWPGDSQNPADGKTNICSGTSFAAAHLSGILLKDIPKKDGLASKDPSAEKPGQPGKWDDARSDPVGIVPP